MPKFLLEPAHQQMTAVPAVFIGHTQLNLLARSIALFPVIGETKSLSQRV